MKTRNRILLAALSLLSLVGCGGRASERLYQVSLADIPGTRANWECNENPDRTSRHAAIRKYHPSYGDRPAVKSQRGHWDPHIFEYITREELFKLGLHRKYLSTKELKDLHLI